MDNIEHEEYLRRNSIINDNGEGTPSPNNYNNQNKIKIDLLMDVISLNISYFNIHRLFNIIQNDNLSKCSKIRHLRDKYGNTMIQFLLKFNNKTYFMTLIDRTLNGFPNSLYIKNPDLSLLQHVKQLLKNIIYHVQKVEFSFDFEGDNNEKIKTKLFKSFYLKWSTKAKQLRLKYKTTRYINNIRKSSRGLKVYEKTRKDKKNVIRMELTCKRRSLKTMNVHTIDDIIDLDINKVISPISFRTFDYDKFLNVHLKHLRRKNKSLSFNYMKNGMTNGSHLLKEAMNIAFEIKQFGIGAGGVLAKKSVDRSDLYIEDSFEKHFKRILDGKSFLTGDHVLVNPEVLFK